MKRTIGFLSLIFAGHLTVIGCGDDPKQSAADAADSGDSSEVSGDVATDTTNDVSTDTTTDTSTDTTTDVPTDTTSDTSTDTTTDSTTDVSEDTEPAVTVTGITISPDGSSLCAGQTLQLGATAAYSDGSSDSVLATWFVVPTSVATIDAATGVVTAVAFGSATVTASFTDPIDQTSFEDTATLTVEAPCLASISVSGPDEVLEGETIDLTANGTFSNGSVDDVAGMVTWESDATDIATVVGGAVTGVAPGAATITARSGAISDTHEVTVIAAEPNLELTGPNGPITDGGVDDAGEQTVGVLFVRTYTISNTGNAPLEISGVTFLQAPGPATNCEQEVTGEPDATVPPDGETTLEITASVPAEGAASCPFTLASNDPDSPELHFDVAAEGTAPAVKKSATATCGVASGFGFLAGVLADFTPDGTLVTTDTIMGNCILTTQVGTLPGGTTVNHGADTAQCGSINCSEANNQCNGFGGAPYSAGSAVTVTMTDVLLGGTATHAFPKAPGTLTRSSIGASVSRSAPLTFTTSGGVAGTLTLVTIQQQDLNGQTTVICEYPADSSSVTVDTSILGLFHDGPFTLLVDTRVQAFSVLNGYDVALIAVNSTTPQQSSFAP